jgi:hypothetical protein
VLASTAIRLRFFLLRQFESFTQLFLAAEEHYPFSQSLLVASHFPSEPPTPATLCLRHLRQQGLASAQQTSVSLSFSAFLAPLPVPLPF